MGFKLFVNDEVVWESEGDARLVERITLLSSQGAAGTLAVPMDMGAAYVRIDEIDAVERAVRHLDVQEARTIEERSRTIEEASVDRVEEGRQLQQEQDQRTEEQNELQGRIARGEISPQEAADMEAENQEGNVVGAGIGTTRVTDRTEDGEASVSGNGDAPADTTAEVAVDEDNDGDTDQPIDL